MRHDYVASIFLLFFNQGIHSVSLSFCRGWMWAHSDVSRQWDTGIQELSWDIPKLHPLWKENPSASRKTPDLENWRPGHWITEMRVQLPYHPELFNIAWYVRDKAMVNTWTGERVNKRQLSKMQEMAAFVLSSSFCIQVFCSLCGKPLSHRVQCCCAALQRVCWGSGTAFLRALPSHLQSWTITVLVQQVCRSVSALLPSCVGEELPHKVDKEEKLESVILCVSIPRQSMAQGGDNLYYC